MASKVFSISLAFGDNRKLTQKLFSYVIECFLGLGGNKPAEVAALNMLRSSRYQSSALRLAKALPFPSSRDAVFRRLT
jgi:hypothetical protein